MARQEEGWPLGLHPLSLRLGLGGRAVNNTMLTGSSTSSTNTSSDLSTKSTDSICHERSNTPGRLIGGLELSRRMPELPKSKKPCKRKSWTWFFSLCSRHST